MSMTNPFSSIAAFRAHCGEPTMALEACPICSKIPARCDRIREDASCQDDSPPEVLLLAKFLDGQAEAMGHDEVLRCPTCHRLYLHDVAWTGAEDYHSTWQRYEVDELFRSALGARHRLPDRDVWFIYDRFFPHHTIVRTQHDVIALDDHNQLTVLDATTLATLIASNPPRVNDPRWARSYAFLVDQVEHLGDRRIERFDDIEWREPLWDFEAQAVVAARRDCLVEEAVVEQVGDEVRARFWVLSGRDLICRVIAVRPDGRYRIEDRPGARYLPVALSTPPFLESREAFRTFCGTPTMPLEQCSICSKLPERCDGDAHDEPPEYKQLIPVVDIVLRCPTCRRLYGYSTFSGGNDIYRGNETTFTLERCTADSLFDSSWAVQQRVPARRIERVSPDRFFPNHLLVRFADNVWGALGERNHLRVLDGRDALAHLIALDPPHQFTDLELATRYAIFVDEIERPGDERSSYFNRCLRRTLTPDEAQQVADAKAATGLPKVFGDDLDLAPTATRDGDRVTVKSWVMSNKRLICRLLTIEPDGRVIAEDAVIAENLPLS